jgi:hypothetical protein
MNHYLAFRARVDRSPAGSLVTLSVGAQRGVWPGRLVVDVVAEQVLPAVSEMMLLVKFGSSDEVGPK